MDQAGGLDPRLGRRTVALARGGHDEEVGHEPGPCREGTDFGANRRARRLARQDAGQAADPNVVEEWKWGIPVWSHDGILCTGETHKKAVKLTFAKGASLKDPAGLFTSSLEGKVRRAIDIQEGEKVDEAAFKALVRQAVILNTSGKPKAAKKAKAGAVR